MNIILVQNIIEANDYQIFITQELKFQINFFQLFNLIFDTIFFLFYIFYEILFLYYLLLFFESFSCVYHHFSSKLITSWTRPYAPSPNLTPYFINPYSFLDIILEYIIWSHLNYIFLTLIELSLSFYSKIDKFFLKISKFLLTKFLESYSSSSSIISLFI